MSKFSQTIIPQWGEILLIEFPPSKEDRKPIRPCLVVSENPQNEHCKWIVVLTMTTEDIENVEISEVYIKNTRENGLDEPSKILCNSPRSIYKERIKKHLGIISKELMEKVRIAWEITFSWGNLNN